MNGNLLIADAGSSKIDWLILSPQGECLAQASSDGVNALLAEADVVEEQFAAAKKSLGDFPEFSEIHYYGAGCATERVCARIREIISEVWKADKINVESDLLAAARALFGHQSGIACILGTGSNSCFYDGEKIASNIPSLGFILGDEGSGAALGKRLLADAFKRQLPEKVRMDFMREYDLSLSDILDRVYREPRPNKFLASLVPFIKNNLWNPYIYSLVLHEFTVFFKRNVAMYPGAHRQPVGFIGGIASGFEPILREAAASQGFSVGKVLTRPLDALAAFHVG